jgi:hypothetical protein
MMSQSQYIVSFIREKEKVTARALQQSLEAVTPWVILNEVNALPT